VYPPAAGVAGIAGFRRGRRRSWPGKWGKNEGLTTSLWVVEIGVGVARRWGSAEAGGGHRWSSGSSEGAARPGQQAGVWAQRSPREDAWRAGQLGKQAGAQEFGVDGHGRRARLWAMAQCSRPASFGSFYRRVRRKAVRARHWGDEVAAWARGTAVCTVGVRRWREWAGGDMVGARRFARLVGVRRVATVY
jgi:hypothetical protein